MKKIVLGLSGGLDSLVSAYLLKQQGFEVIGLYFQLYLPNNLLKFSVEKAKNAAELSKIPLKILDLKDVFKRKIIDNFCNIYLNGQTPNPCIICNEYIKFHYLYKYAVENNIEYIATGHYAQKIFDENTKKYYIKKGNDKKKDQSYFLYRISQKILEKTIFPLANLNKEKVKLIGEQLGFDLKKNSESQEICFIPDNNYPEFIENYTNKKSIPGDIVDITGKKIGVHRGITHYTIGQRKGLGISAPQPLFVVDIIPEKNIIVADTSEKLLKKELTATDLVWANNSPSKNKSYIAKLRYRHDGTKSSIKYIDESKLILSFPEPQRAITEGQSVVLYDDDKVIGGGIINSKRITDFS